MRRRFRGLRDCSSSRLPSRARESADAPATAPAAVAKPIRRPEIMTSTDKSPETLPALGICFEEYEYPYPVQFFPLTNDLRPLKMAYMDIAPDKEPNGQTVVLIHGKAFGCYYFRNVIQALTASGYRVVAPDQIGWGKSPKPDIHYSFQQLAANTAALLDYLGVGRVAVLGHSAAARGDALPARAELDRPDRHPRLRQGVLRASRPAGLQPPGRPPDPRHAEPGLPKLGPGRGPHLPDDLPAAGPLRISPARAADTADRRRQGPRRPARPVREARGRRPARWLRR